MIKECFLTAESQSSQREPEGDFLAFCLGVLRVSAVGAAQGVFQQPANSGPGARRQAGQVPPRCFSSFWKQSH